MIVNEAAADQDSISVNMQNAHDDPGVPAGKAAFALYRPEPPAHMKVPLDSQAAVRKYRMEPTPGVFSDDKRDRKYRHVGYDSNFRHATKQVNRPTHMRGRTYAGPGGMVSYLGTGDGNRIGNVKHNSFVHGTGFQNASMTTHHRRNHPTVSSMQNTSTGAP